jgi:N6-adenosine-specific RNA methylase IME4
MDATRKLGEMMDAQKQTVGLNEGGRPKTGLLENPVLPKPTLASQGIDKNLANQARLLAGLDEAAYEQRRTEAREAVTRVMRRVVNEVQFERERQRYRERTYQGGTVDDLSALAASGYRAGVIYADPPWLFEIYGRKGKGRDVERHYDTMTLGEIKALPVPALAADDCALLLWAVWPNLPAALEVIEAWGFEYKTCGFCWVKTTPSGGLATGMGLHTRNNSEPCLVATRGAPTRLNADVHQVIMEQPGEHSKKPEEAARRIERLYPGPYLEMFARRERTGWQCWGNEVPA